MESKGSPGRLGASKANVAKLLQSEPECSPPISSLLSATITYRHPPLLTPPGTFGGFHLKPAAKNLRNLVRLPKDSGGGQHVPCVDQLVLSPKGWIRVCDTTGLAAATQWCPMDGQSSRLPVDPLTVGQLVSSAYFPAPPHASASPLKHEEHPTPLNLLPD